MTGYGKAFSTAKPAPDKGRGHSLVARCQSLPEATSLLVRSVLNRVDAPKTASPAAGLVQPQTTSSLPQENLNVCHTSSPLKVK